MEGFSIKTVPNGYEVFFDKRFFDEAFVQKWVQWAEAERAAFEEKGIFPKKKKRFDTIELDTRGVDLTREE